jgi:hypothetical protein
MTLDVFLLILRILLIVLLYLFLMQVVIAISRDLKKTAVAPQQSVAKSSAPGHLVVVDSGPSRIAPGTIFPLKLQTTIGRGPSNTVQIPETFISGEHAHMWYQNNSWYIQDVGSTNGTWLNNQPAREALPAHFGDTIQVGFIKFLLRQ